MLLALRRFEDRLQARLHAAGFADVSVAQVNLLRHLDPDGMRMVALAVDAGVSKQAVSQGIRGLVQRDLVALEPDPDDGRARRVVYTDRGRALVAAAIEGIVEIEGEWAKRLGREAYVALREGLGAL